MSTVETGSIFGGYRIEGVVGRGGMGIVYRARQLRPDRLVALKVIAPELAADPEFRDRFERESQIAASLEHPNVIPVYEVNEHAEQLFLVMRYVEGTDLRELIRKGIPPEQAARLVSQVAGALDAAHARGLVHRDIKPGNILVAEAQDHAYLTDFGLAKSATGEGGPTKTGAWVGSIDYVPPEQIGGERVDARADIYSLTAVLFHALTRRPPYPRDSEVSKMWAHMNEDPPSILEHAPGLRREFEEVIKRGMAKRPDDRYPSAGDLGKAALAAAAGRDTMVSEQSVAAGRAAPAPTGDETRARGAPSETLAGTTTADGPPAGTIIDEAPAGTHGGGVVAAPPQRRPRTTLFVLLGVLAVAAAAGLFVALSGSDDKASAPGPGTVEGAPIPVGSKPTAIATGEGSAWVGSSGTDSITRIGLESGQVEGKPIPVGNEPYGVAVGEGSVWVGNFKDGTVSRIDPRAGKVTGEPIRVGKGPADVAVGLGSVWTANYEDNTVSRIDPKAGRAAATIKVGQGPIDVAVDQGAVWVTNVEEDTLSRVNPSSNEVVSAAIPVGESPESVAVGAGGVWVGNIRVDTVTRVDPNSSQVSGQPIAVGERPDDVVVAGDSVWVANQDADSVVRIDSATRKVGPPLKVGNAPSSLSFGGGFIWVANFQSETVVRVRP